MTLSYKLDFLCLNNEARYEAFILGILSAQELDIQRLKVRGDSNLIVEQIKGHFTVKELIPAPYCTVAQKVMDGFKEITIEYVSQIKNRQPDALASIASRVHMTNETLKVDVIKKINSSLGGLKTLPQRCGRRLETSHSPLIGNQR